MDEIIQIFQKNNGYARMKDLKNSGVHTRKLAKAVKDGLVTKVSPGLYKLLDFPWDQNEGFVDVCNTNKKAVICLLSAASYYDITTFNPPKIYAAFPQNIGKLKIDYPPVKPYYFIQKYYELGIETENTASGSFRIYNKEKTIVDLFRYMSKIGDDVVIESLNNYLKDKTSSINKLMEYAILCKTDKEMLPYI